MNSHFCIIPWLSLQIRQDGNVYPCCRMSYFHPMGNLEINSLKEIWNNEEYKKTRQNMLDGKPVSFCSNCYAVDSAGGYSARQRFNEEFSSSLKLTESTNPDGSLNEMKLRHLDIRFSNVCNLKCRSCDSESSTAWYNDSVELFGNKRKKLVRLSDIKSDFWTEIEKQLETIEEIYFAGGEPLIDENHYKFLELLLAKNRSDILLRYNTNITVLKYGKWFAPDVWSKFNRVQIGASVDAVGPLAELVRSGSDWETVKENLLYIKNNCPNVHLKFFTTVGVLNCFHLPILVNKLIDLKLLQTSEQFEINMLFKPDPMSAAILNTVERKNLHEHYKKFLKDVESKCTPDLHQHLCGQIEFFENSIAKMDNTRFRHNFRQYTFKLDKLRNEKTRLLVPEVFNILYEEHPTT